MTTHTLGIIFNGATGRIGSTQHLNNALTPIRREGGLPLGDDRIMPRIKLVGRNAEKLAAVAKANDIAEWTTDLDAALKDAEFPVFFDAAATHTRLGLLQRAVAAGKHIYTEKPAVPTVEDGLALVRAAEARGVKHGAVEDKLSLPGMEKLAHLMKIGFFGRVLNFKLDFGWWVFDGVDTPAQRPSWNYQKTGGGGLMLDMYPHWRYLLEGLLGPIESLVSAAWTAIPDRIDERGQRYTSDVDDSVATLLRLANGAFGTVTSSWATRVRRDDLITLQVDGTHGSAVAGLHRCRVQSNAETPKVAGFNVMADAGIDYYAQWGEAPALSPVRNGYRAGWEGFLRHVVADTPFGSTLRAGIRDVQLAEACRRSATERTWVTMEELR